MSKGNLEQSQASGYYGSNLSYSSYSNARNRGVIKVVGAPRHNVNGAECVLPVACFSFESCKKRVSTYVASCAVSASPTTTSLQVQCLCFIPVRSVVVLEPTNQNSLFIANNRRLLHAKMNASGSEDDVLCMMKKLRNFNCPPCSSSW
ncbi:hypothetical protein HUJ04_011464 [Dendroctonus ponderosae]|nr:hypothetical protein HUJ04_011464 [Dendroctonus ponderosae]